MFPSRRYSVRVPDAGYDHARAFARELDLPEDATRSQLLTALSRSRRIVASLPVAVDDSDDLEQVLRQLPPDGLRAGRSVGWRAVTPRIPSRQPRYKIKVLAVLCADSDGSKAAKITESALTTLFQDLSNLYYCVGLSFTHTTTVLHNTVINQDFTLPTNADLSSPAQPISKAQKDTSFDEHNAVRSEWARQYPGRLVVFFRYGTSVKWNEVAQKWVVGPATFAFSGSGHEFVAMGHSTESILLAHEAGHYFHLSHTHNDIVTLTDAEKDQYPDDKDPADREARRQLLRSKAIEAIRGYVDDKGHAPESGLKIFDADGLDDTPPDPATQIFYYEFGNACSSQSIALDVNLKSGNRPYTLDPARDIIMSYFFRCPGGKRFSEQEIDRIRASLETPTFTGNVLSRHHLIAPSVKIALRKYLPRWRLKPPPVISRMIAPLRNLIRRTGATR